MWYQEGAKVVSSRCYVIIAHSSSPRAHVLVVLAARCF